MKPLMMAAFGALGLGFYALSGGAEFDGADRPAAPMQASADPAPWSEAPEPPAVARVSADIRALIRFEAIRDREGPLDAEEPADLAALPLADEIDGELDPEPIAPEPQVIAPATRTANALPAPATTQRSSARPAAFRMVDGRARPVEVVSRRVGTARFIRVPKALRTSRVNRTDQSDQRIESARVIRYLPAPARAVDGDATLTAGLR